MKVEEMSRDLVLSVFVLGLICVLSSSASNVDVILTTAESMNHVIIGESEKDASGLKLGRLRDPEPENCTVINEFIVTIGGVLDCVSRSSTPATYCTDCQRYFKSWYTALEKMKNSTACKKVLNDDSSVATSPSLLGRVANETASYWRDSRCETCTSMNQTELQNFRNIDAQLAQCLSSNQTCSMCLPIYKDMQELYTALGNGHGCVELKDRLNRTQHNWNQKGCLPPTPDITTAMILSGFFAILPAVFYTYLRIFGARRTRKLLRAGAASTASAPPPTTSTGAMVTTATQPLLAEGASTSNRA